MGIPGSLLVALIDGPGRGGAPVQLPRIHTIKLAGVGNVWGNRAQARMNCGECAALLHRAARQQSLRCGEIVKAIPGKLAMQAN